MGLASGRGSLNTLLGLLVAISSPFVAENTAWGSPVPQDSSVTPRFMPEPTMLQTGDQRMSLSGGIIIQTRSSAGNPAGLAAHYLRLELHRRVGVEVTVDASASSESAPRALIILADSTDPELGQLLAGAALIPMPGPDGYLVSVSPDRRLAVVVGTGGGGIIQGAFALAQWTHINADGPYWRQATFSQTPAMQIRIARSITFGHRKIDGMDEEALALAQLDWWARWGLNYTFLPSKARGEQPKEQVFARWYIREAHARGMKVGANMGGRSLCAADPNEMAAYAEKARRALLTGCDFVQVLFDDLPSTRTAGHCERCVERFGGSLAREQRHILESLQETVEQFGPDRKLIWCPTYYSLGMTGYRQAAEGPEAYFSILGQSPAVRRAWMYHCAFDREFNAYLDSKGLARRIWWYNGIRTPYYMVSREFDGFEGWGKRLVIPGVKDFQSFFSPFENGWLLPSYASADPSQHPCVAPLVPASRDAHERILIPRESWEELKQIGGRVDGIYYCGGTTPYHIAMTGLFAVCPERFDPRQAAEIVRAAMFGPAGGKLAGRWQEAYEECQLILARAEGRPLSGQALTKVQELIAAMAECESGLREENRTQAVGLPSPVLEALLDEMSDWQARVRTCATDPSALLK
jgi:hypothetical protein